MLPRGAAHAPLRPAGKKGAIGYSSRPSSESAASDPLQATRWRPTPDHRHARGFPGGRRWSPRSSGGLIQGKELPVLGVGHEPVGIELQVHSNRSRSWKRSKKRCQLRGGILRKIRSVSFRVSSVQSSRSSPSSPLRTIPRESLSSLNPRRRRHWCQARRRPRSRDCDGGRSSEISLL